ncbi:NAD-dependent epimerase/dehydratase family protein [Rathayibacter sp. VKM Ac-2803]|uniref:NAD-dependent epimerase/dehydratase family protein n=1 Tax=unclassified Rathayibacter TaxID=2609250 RepID=UPI00135A5566|nr:MULTISPECIES: NAD-dependent epimerase/dehydratase family protein [unclassified Rathayibacter]MWV47891.1 NAD-dependent epimerase/dehydratase family protein [Rathayibacter sp. VKM Ac-2803]MWV58894.1 NAD-dependent epimerase/dehydratase family protein [Rathayibacter sp. VKM Ac-2754]
MKLLILGGTAWLGRQLATEALERGHDVTCVARGTDVPLGARLVRADRDSDDALAGVAAERWDAVLDVARQPGHVRRAVRDLAPVAERYLFVSTGNVYASQAFVGADEDAELLSALAADSYVDADDYGSAKVACEQAVLEGFGESRSLIARAGLLGGPGDPTGRSTYWPWRFAHPAVEGAVLVPDAPELPAAVLDVRDLAAWLVRCAALGTAGVFNAAGVAVPLPAFLAAAAAGSSAEPVRAPEQWLKDHGVNEWAGPRSLPLWLADRSWYGMNARSTARAEAAGLVRRPLEETLRDGAAAGFVGGVGLPDTDERELIGSLRP